MLMYQLHVDAVRIYPECRLLGMTPPTLFGGRRKCALSLVNNLYLTMTHDT